MLVKFILRIFTVALVFSSVMFTTQALALREIAPSERGSLCDVRGVCPDSSSLFSQKDAQIVSCPGDKDFIKSRSSNKASINGLTPSFVCQLAKFLRMNPGVTVSVGTYKTTATTNCDRRQCRTGPNANGGTHEKGCAADLRFGGQKGPGGPPGPPWCTRNNTCSRAHSTAPGAGLQFPLMPGGSRNTGYYEVWHIEPIGSRAGYCPTGAESQAQTAQGWQGGGQGGGQNGGQNSGNGGDLSQLLKRSGNNGPTSEDWLRAADTGDYNDLFPNTDSDSEFVNDHGDESNSYFSEDESNVGNGADSGTEMNGGDSGAPDARNANVIDNKNYYDTTSGNRSRKYGWYRFLAKFLGNNTQAIHIRKRTLALAVAGASQQNTGDIATKKADIKDIYGLNPDFALCAASLLKRAQEQDYIVNIVSGYRSKDFQRRLYNFAYARHGAEKAQHWVEKPNVSTHVNGIALDLVFASDEVRTWFYDNAKKFGLHFPYEHKPEHLVAYTNLCASNNPSPYGLSIDPEYKPNQISLAGIKNVDIESVPQIQIQSGSKIQQATSTDDATSSPLFYEEKIEYTPWSIKYKTRKNGETRNIYTGLFNFFKSDLSGVGNGISFWDIVLIMLGLR